MSAHQRPRRRAFSLIDTLAAIVLISVAAPLMLLAIGQSTLRRATATQAITARWLLSEKLESITADRHSTTRGYTYLTTANYPAEAPVAGYPNFTRNTTITETTADLTTPGTGYKTVTVTVTWIDPTAGTRTSTLSTVVTDY
jgi:type II secretory pathway pseudopilin PulG